MGAGAHGKNLIWIGANQAGNSVNVQRRALFALMAPSVIRQSYAVDGERVYVTGLSGGGKMASMISAEYPHVFKGAIFNCGAEFWDRPPPRFEELKANRFVFVTGEHDQALRPTKRVYRRYEKAGVPNIKLMVIPGMGHENPDAEHLEEALGFLDLD
jgi:poly(3-hydroxybutyrate) depolymerase